MELLAMALQDTNRQKNTTAPDRLLRSIEVASKLGISQRLVWRLRASGKLPAVQLGGATRFRLSDVQRLMDSGSV